MSHAIIDLSIVIIATVVLSAIGWWAWCLWQDLRRQRAAGTSVRRATLAAIALRESRQGWTDGPTWRLRGGR